MKKNNQIYIVIPSYNEVKNVSILVKRLTKTFPFAKLIIVDDSSEIENKKLKKVVKGYKNVRIISRLKKEGRGSAVLLGFSEALKDKSAKFVFEMDSDLAHDPNEMHRFTEIKGQHDLIIGSRYLPGSRIVNISPDRTVLSRVINKFLAHWLGMGLSDHTSGFRLYNRKSLEYLTKQKIKSKGFITLSETAYLLYLKGFKIGEVPITWNYRKYGKSNVNTKELFDSLLFVLRMKRAK